MSNKTVRYTCSTIIFYYSNPWFSKNQIDSSAKKKCREARPFFYLLLNIDLLQIIPFNTFTAGFAKISALNNNSWKWHKGFKNESTVITSFLFLAKHLALHGCRSAYSSQEASQKAAIPVMQGKSLFFKCSFSR